MAGYEVRKFICLTDNNFYLKANHRGYSEALSLFDRRKSNKNEVIIPTWVGKWKSKERDKLLQFKSDVLINWIQKMIGII